MQSVELRLASLKGVRYSENILQQVQVQILISHWSHLEHLTVYFNRSNQPTRNTNCQYLHYHLTYICRKPPSKITLVLHFIHINHYQCICVPLRAQQMVPHDLSVLSVKNLQLEKDLVTLKRDYANVAYDCSSSENQIP